MRTLAIDLGSKRVGLALSDEGGRFATPLDVVHVSDESQALSPIVALVRKESVQRIILGLPLNMDDTLGAQARRVIDWSGQLKRRVDVPILFVDERLSTFDADEQLAQRRAGGERLTRQMKKDRRDALAAATLLRGYLDGTIPAIDLPQP